MSKFNGGRDFPVVCVTGPMASGKNFVSSILEKKGWMCVDADKIVHVVLQKLQGQIIELHSERAEQMGLSLENPDGTLNRRAVGQIVFNDSVALKEQEELVHPMVEKMLCDFILEHSKQPVVLNATVLYKTPELMKQCDFVLFVEAPCLIRFFRAKKRDKLPAKQIFSRFHSQKNIFAKYKKSNADIYKVWNLGFSYPLERRIERILLIWNKKELYG